MVRTARSVPGLLVAAALLLPAPTLRAASPSPIRPVATYSIVARDALTGELGVAVQSHWFSVGSVVGWADAGVGAVATQSFTEVSYGPLGLAAMREGATPKQALAALLAADPHPEVRQVAFVDAEGRTATHTGAGCIEGAGHRRGEGYSVQANLMLTDDVPDAMAVAFERAEGPLAERMLAALEAAQRAGGDVRGKQSAALLVVNAEASERPWNDRQIDLRIEDHPDPIVELRRLLALHRAYEHMNRGDEAVAAGDMQAAMDAYERAEQMFPDNDEFLFWHAVTLVNNDRLDESLPLFDRAFRINPSWLLLVPRLVDAGQLPASEGLAEKILSVAPNASKPQNPAAR